MYIYIFSQMKNIPTLKKKSNQPCFSDLYLVFTEVVSFAGEMHLFCCSYVD